MEVTRWTETAETYKKKEATGMRGRREVVREHEDFLSGLLGIG